MGYGVQKKSVLTSSVSRVVSEDLDEGHPTNLQNALKGKVSGVTIISDSGQPGAGSKIRIRGTSTINDSDPLYIVDGMPSENGIDHLNPTDIESVEILKDAASAAIYGARGANGVVLVTTKEGKKGQTTFDYEFTYGMQNPANKVSLTNAADYMMLINEMAANSGKDPYFTSPSKYDTDWQSVLQNTNAPVINHKASLSGGNDNSNYYISFGYLACLGETSGYGYVVVAAGTARILFQFDANQAGETGAFGVVPMAGEGEKAVTVLDKGKSYYGGFRFERIDGGASTVVNMVDQEDYIKGVIPYEMSPSWPLEALKAQAVCARTYVNGVNHSAYHFDVCTTTHCQVYKGTSGAGPVSDQAVEETAGLKIYYDGKCINGGAVYYSSNGGASEDVKNVWGTSHAYLKGKFDPYEADVANIAGNYRWSVSYTASELKTRLNDKLKEKGYTFGDIASVNIKQSEFGNVVEMQVIDSAGRSNTISRGDTIRSVLGTNSIHFTMVVSGGAKQEPGYMVAGAGSNAPDLEGLYALNGDGAVSSLPAQSYIITAEGVKPLEPVAGETVTGSGEATYTFSGTGWGHNVGMSQWGANAMAKRGYTYLDILQFYYTDITVE